MLNRIISAILLVPVTIGIILALRMIGMLLASIPCHISTTAMGIGIMVVVVVVSVIGTILERRR